VGGGLVAKLHDLLGRLPETPELGLMREDLGLAGGDAGYQGLTIIDQGDLLVCFESARKQINGPVFRHDRGLR
jgi:hypothetical protein